MTMMAKLKLTSEERHKPNPSTEDTLRSRLLERLDEQLELLDADMRGERLAKTRRIYITNDAGERVAQDAPRRLRKWYWRSPSGKWLVELRYGGKPLKLSGDKTAVEAASQAELKDALSTLTEAVRAGELDKALTTAKKERTAIMRRAKK